MTNSGFYGKGTSNSDALALSAAELVRIAINVLRAQADDAQQFYCAILNLLVSSPYDRYA